MGAGGERHDVDADVIQLRDLQEPFELLPHDLGAAHQPVQYGLFHHHPQRGRVGPVQQALAAQPQIHPPCQVLVGLLGKPPRSTPRA